MAEGRLGEKAAEVQPRRPGDHPSDGVAIAWELKKDVRKCPTATGTRAWPPTDPARRERGRFAGGRLAISSHHRSRTSGLSKANERARPVCTGGHRGSTRHDWDISMRRWASTSQRLRRFRVRIHGGPRHPVQGCIGTDRTPADGLGEPIGKRVIAHHDGFGAWTNVEPALSIGLGLDLAAAPACILARRPNDQRPRRIADSRTPGRRCGSRAERSSHGVTRSSAPASQEAGPAPSRSRGVSNTRASARVVPAPKGRAAVYAKSRHRCHQKRDHRLRRMEAVANPAAGRRRDVLPLAVNRPSVRVLRLLSER